MSETIYRDSVSAWGALCEIGGLEPNGRDADLVDDLIKYLQPGENDLERVLSETPTDAFLQALFHVIQPFSKMYEQVLKFFQEAATREGQSQWKVVIDEDVFGFEFFQEFLDNWKKLYRDFDLPQLDQSSAFILNSVRIEDGDYGYLREAEKEDRSVVTGLSDVDDWIMAHDRGEYIDFPTSLDPKIFPSGLQDAARITHAAILTIQRSGMDREKLIEEHRARGYKCIAEDALHPWTIAQSETDFWIRSSVLYLASLVRKPIAEREAFGNKLAERFSEFPRRQFVAEVEINDFEKLLSLPAWKKRYEFYGVWIASQIVQACVGHDYSLNSENGQFKFSFSEAKIADFHSSKPPLELYSERYTKASNLLGKTRSNGVQPDFGIWEAGLSPLNCKMIVEVKHYKKRSRRNFRDALIDYANAHPSADVLLVNYGPVGADFDDLPLSVADRCQMIGQLHPNNPVIVDNFHEFIRQRVGEPYVPPLDLLRSVLENAPILIIDVSGSMKSHFETDWFNELIAIAEERKLTVYMIDNQQRAVLPARELRRWLKSNLINASTSLREPVSNILMRHPSAILLTDQDGVQELSTAGLTISTFELSDESDAKLLKITGLDER